MSEDEANWLHTDAAEDVAGSIRHALICRDLSTADAHAWKWFAIAIHSALQSACICHLTTTAEPIGALERESTKVMLEWLDLRSGGPPPRVFVANLPDLLKRVRKPRSAGDGSDRRVSISDGDLEWLKRFHEGVRNQFLHFEPMHWSLEVSGLPALAALVARIISEIDRIGWAFRHKDEDWLSSLRTSLGRLTAGT